MGPFLTEDPTPDRILEAVVWNQRQWLLYSARMKGGEVHRGGGATWVCTPGPDGYWSIVFPQMSSATADRQLDAVMEYYRSRRPSHMLIYWSLDPPRPRDLGARLQARGFEAIDWLNWMWVDLEKMRADHPAPPGLRVDLIGDEPIGEVDDLPHYSRTEAEFRRAASRARPRRVWHFGAWLEGRPVAHCALFITRGRLGVAGIWTCGVVPDARNQGIGKAVTVAACRLAQTLGCRYAILNATGMGEPVYRRIGFEKIGAGKTWWMHPTTLAAAPPPRWQVAVAEAVARGDLAALERLGGTLSPAALDRRLPNAATLIQLAVDSDQPAAVEWLVEHGATLDVLSAWDLGWKDRVRQLVAASREPAHRRYGHWQITPLHAAAERGDTELARVLLAADPDLEIRDADLNATPLEWAQRYERPEIVALIQQHQDRVNGPPPGLAGIKEHRSS
jgi:GNAT superfamily N-acetyltransferase